MKNVDEQNSFYRICHFVLVLVSFVFLHKFRCFVTVDLKKSKTS